LYVIIGKKKFFLDFVHLLNYKISKLRFGSWILFSSLGKGLRGGKRAENYLLGPLAELPPELDQVCSPVSHFPLANK
jgi:hypothetical protein